MGEFTDNIDLSSGLGADVSELVTEETVAEKIQQNSEGLQLTLVAESEAIEGLKDPQLQPVGEWVLVADESLEKVIGLDHNLDVARGFEILGSKHVTVSWKDYVEAQGYGGIQLKDSSDSNPSCINTADLPDFLVDQAEELINKHEFAREQLVWMTQFHVKESRASYDLQRIEVVRTGSGDRVVIRDLDDPKKMVYFTSKDVAGGRLLEPHNWKRFNPLEARHPPGEVQFIQDLPALTEKLGYLDQNLAVIGGESGVSVQVVDKNETLVEDRLHGVGRAVVANPAKGRVVLYSNASSGKDFLHSNWNPPTDTL